MARGQIVDTVLAQPKYEYLVNLQNQNKKCQYRNMFLYNEVNKIFFYDSKQVWATVIYLVIRFPEKIYHIIVASMFVD